MKNLNKTILNFSVISALVLFPTLSFSQNIGGLLGGVLGGITGNNKPNDSKTSDSKSSGPSAAGVIGLVGGLVTVATSSTDTNEEIKVGDGVAASVLGAAKIWENPKAQRYVNLVGNHIAQHSERKNLPWSFAIIDTASINAFAAPGGTILITRGLYEILSTEDELAAVLSHEIAHVNRGHHYNVIKNQKMVALGANFVQKEISKGDAIADKLVNIGSELIARGLDKDAEYEADSDSLTLSARSGYNSSAMLSVLEKLNAKVATGGDLQLLFQTHPAPNDRIQKITALSNPEIENAAIDSPAANRIKSEGF